MNAFIAVIVLLGVYLLLELKTSRPDGTLISVHPYRRLMGIIMPTRTESVVYFDSWVDAEALQKFVQEHQDRPGSVSITHCVIAAGNIALSENPTMNRFVMGGRVYQRKGRWITFSMKRKKLDKSAKLAVVKLPMEDGESFFAFCDRINGQVHVNRSGEKTYADKEFALFNGLPRFVLRWAVVLLRFCNDRNLLPKFFIEGDGLFTSIFIANLGSIGMGSGFHHLYEWGTCPIFMTVGKVEARPVVLDGAVVSRPQLHIRFTYDERIDDGLSARHAIDSVKRILEAPNTFFGDTPMGSSQASSTEA